MAGCCMVETSLTAAGPRSRLQCITAFCHARYQKAWRALLARSRDAEVQPGRSQLTCRRLFSGHTYVIEVPSRLTQLRWRFLAGGASGSVSRACLRSCSSSGIVTLQQKTSCGARHSRHSGEGQAPKVFQHALPDKLGMYSVLHRITRTVSTSQASEACALRLAALSTT